MTSRKGLEAGRIRRLLHIVRSTGVLILLHDLERTNWVQIAMTKELDWMIGL